MPLLFLPLCGACGRSAGDVALSVDLPSADALDPSKDPRLATLQLTVTEPGVPPSIESVAVTPGERSTFDLPAIDPSPAAIFTLAGLSQSGQVLAYGRSAATAVDLGADLTLTLRLRKPYLFVGGGGSLDVYDTVAPTDESCSSPPCFVVPALSAVPSPLDVMPVPDGSAVLAETADRRLLAVSTKDDQLLPQQASLPHDQPGPLGVSPDGRWAVVPYPASGDLAIVDLASLGGSGGSLGVKDVPMAATPGRAGMSDSSAFVLENPANPLPSLACGAASPSAVQAVDLASASAAGATFTLGTAAADLAAVGGTGYLAEPCMSQIATIDLQASGGTAPEIPWAPLPIAPLALAVSDTSLYAAGLTTGLGTPAEIDQVTFAAKHVTRLQIPVPPERVLFGLMSPTTTGVLDVQPSSVELYDLAVSPAGQRAAVLAHVVFQSRNLVTTDPCGFPVKVDDFDVDTYYYMLIDLGTGALLQRARFSCSLNDIVDSTNPWGFSCSTQADNPGEQVFGGGAQFVPVGAAILDGSN